MKVYADRFGRLIYQAATVEEEANAPVEYREWIEFDPETHPELMYVLRTHWHVATLKDGVVSCPGETVVMRDAGLKYRSALRAQEAETAVNSMPEWATMTPKEAASKVRTALDFGGISLGQAEAAVDNITNLAGAKVVLKQIVQALFAVWAVDERMAEILVHLRDIAVRR